MNAFLSLGRWVFPFPFAILGVLQLMNAQEMADQVAPAFLPARAFWVYLSGAGLVAAAAAMFVGKYDKLASTLLAVLLLLIILLVQVPDAMANDGGAANALRMVFKDLGLMAGAMIYAQKLARDHSVVG